jgi:outer membrane biosynthesis protein TonB
MAMRGSARWALALSVSVALHGGAVWILAPADGTTGHLTARDPASLAGSAGVLIAVVPLSSQRQSGSSEPPTVRGAFAHTRALAARGAAATHSQRHAASASRSARREPTASSVLSEDGVQAACLANAAEQRSTAAPSTPEAEAEKRPLRAGANATGLRTAGSVAAERAAETDAGAGGGGAADGARGSVAGVGSSGAARLGRPLDDNCWLEVARELVARAQNDIPRALRERGLVGKVVIVFRLGRGGLVESARVEASSGYALLDQATLGLLSRPFSTTCQGEGRWPLRWWRR